MRNTRILLVLAVVIFVSLGVLLGATQWQEEAFLVVEGNVRLMIEDQVIFESEELFTDSTGVYLPYEIVKTHIYPEIIMDEEQKRVVIPLEDKPMTLEDESLTSFVKENEVEINILTKNENGIIYVPVEFLKKILGIDITYVEASKTVMIDKWSTEKILGTITKENIKLHKKPGLTSGSVEELKLKDSLRIYGEEDNWYRVRSEKGEIGYVQKKYIRPLEIAWARETQLNKKRENFDVDGRKINIAWEYVHEKTLDITKETKIDSLDVLVPTWFHIETEDGTVTNNGDRNYVKNAHEKGYKVWGLVTNSFDPKLTSKILQEEDLRKKVIGQLITYASLYDLDGINIDFENIYYKDKALLVQFMKELKDQVKKQNLVLSIDVTVPSTSEQWSKVYDRKALAKIVDYVAVMAYDEHWGTSPKSGSVASIGWVEKGIVRSLESIPSEKILLGIPFYTRLWKETKDEAGNIKVESKALAMGKAKEMIQEKDAVILWNEEQGQYYAQYDEEGVTYKIWLEDPRSIALKVSLVEKYDLAGTGAWRRGFEDKEVWAVLQEMTKKGKEYHQLVFNDN